MTAVLLDIAEGTMSISEQFFANVDGVLVFFAQHGGDILWKLLMTVVILAGARILLSVVSRATKHVMESDRYHKTDAQGKRVNTVMTLTRSVARYGIYTVALLLILEQFHLGAVTASLLGAAGIGSLAIGFGAQNLVKDVVTGFFMMFENQFAVGDYIKTDEAEGTVEATAVRVTYLRTFKGEQVIIPNGSIARVINYTRGGAVAEIVVSTAYEADTRQVMEIIKSGVDRYAKENPDAIVEPPVVAGITKLGESGVDITVRCKVLSLRNWEVERGMRLAVKEEFDRQDVEFPYPRCVIVPFGDHHHPASMASFAPDSQQPAWASMEDPDKE